jgi:hypothetical protein
LNPLQHIRFYKMIKPVIQFIFPEIIPAQSR